MGKGCCDLKFTETDDGFRVEVKGKDIKSHLKAFIEKCCSFCGPSDKKETKKEKR